VYVSLPTDENIPLKIQESMSKCHHLLQGVKSQGQESLSTVLLTCGGLRTPKGVWIWQCVPWKSALLWDSGFCRKQHSCGQTYRCHREL